MRFYIAKDENVLIRLEGQVRTRSGYFDVTKIIPSSSNEDSEVAKKICKKLQVALESVTENSNVSGCRSSKHPRIEPLPSQQRQASVRIEVQLDSSNPLVTNDTVPIYVTGVNIGYLNHFKKILQLLPAFMKMKIMGDLKWQEVSPGTRSVKPSEMGNFGHFETQENFLGAPNPDNVYKFEDGKTTDLIIKIDNYLAAEPHSNSANAKEIWNNRDVVICGKFTVELIVDGLNEDFFVDSNIRETMSINRKILTEALGWDMIIVADNGTSIRCHKAFLEAHSKVFATTLNGKLKEGASNEIKMSRTEEEIRALLAFLYCWDTSEPADNPILAVQLYKLGHEYGIQPLQTCMAKILETRDPKDEGKDWLDTEMALSLFRLVEGLNNKDFMKRVVYRFFQTNAKELTESQSFREIFEKTPSLAINMFGEVCGWKDTN